MGLIQAFWFLMYRIRDGDNTLRYRYPLGERNVVWDVGGYVGEWSEVMHQRYRAKIVIFEPVRKYHRILQERFYDAPNIIIKRHGLSGKDAKVFFSEAGIGSSQYKLGREPVVLKDVASQVKGTVDLLKLNIEGGEYDVLDRLISTGKIKNIRYLQIQFHDFVPGASERRKRIVRELKKTHRRVYCYPWIWEGWELR